jgi:hypothetical protein
MDITTSLITCPLLLASLKCVMFINGIATSPMAKYWVVSPGRYYVKA